MALVVTLAIFNVVGLVLTHDYHTDLRMGKNNIKEMINVYHENIHLMMGNLTHILQTVAQNPMDEERLQTFFPQAQTTLSSLQTLFVLDAEGNILASSHSLPFKRENLSEHPSYLAHLTEEHHLYIGSPQQIDSQLFLPISWDARDENGNLQAIIVALIDPLYFNRLFAILSEKEGESGLLLHTDGTILLTFPDDQNASPLKSKLFDATGNFHPSEEYIAEYRILEPWPLIITFQQPKAKVLAHFYNHFFWAMTSVTLLLLLLGYGTYHQIRQTQHLIKQNFSLQRLTHQLKQTNEKLQDEIAKRQQVKEALRFQAHLLNVVEQAVIATDLDGHIIYWNRFAETLYGWKSSEILVQNLFELLNLSSELYQNILLDLKNGKSWSGELTTYRKKGTSFLSLFTISPLYNEQNERIGMVSISSDISKYRQTETALLQSEEKYRFLVENAGIGITSYTPRGEIFYLNSLAAHYLGGVQTDFIGKTFYELPLDASWINRIKDRFEHSIQTGKPSFYDDDIPLPSGNKSFLSTYQPIRDITTGEVISIQIFSNDITEYKQAQKALQKSEQRFKTLIENSYDGILLYNVQKIIDYVSPSIKNLLGYQPPDLVGTDGCKYVAPADRDQFKEEWDSLQPSQSSFTELRMKCKQGKVIWVEMTLTNLLHDPNIKAMVSNFKDITERKLGEQIQDRALQQQEDFIELAGTTFNDVTARIRQLVKHDAQTLAVERVSIWLLGPAQDKIICETLYTLSTDTYEQNLILHQADYPVYFAALQIGRPIVATDAQNDPRTQEFAQLLLDPHGIGAMLDVPIRVHGKVVGVLCHEHRGGPREWFIDQQEYAASIADQVALALLRREQQQAEQHLRGSEEQLKLVLENAKLGLWDWNLTTGKLIYDQNLAYILGYKADELSNQIEDWISTIHPDDQDRVFALLSHHLQSDDSLYEVEYRSYKKSGEWIWVYARGSVQERDLEGQALRMMGTLQDITERKQSETALLESEEKFRVVTEQSLAGIMIFQDRRLIYANQTVSRINEYPMEEMMAWGPEDYLKTIHPQDQEFVKQQGRKKFKGETEEVENHYISRIVTRRGKTKWIELFSKVIPYQGKNAILSTIIDITERKQAEAEVRKLNAELEKRVQERTAQLSAVNKELESFSYSVSHDLRAPLRHIDGFIRLLHQREQERLDETSLRYMQIIAEAVGRMGQLIDDLLAFSRTGRTEIRTRPLELNKLVREVQKELSFNTKIQNIYWKIHPLPTVEGDPILLRVVWMNLLSNAIKYTAPCPEARIEIGMIPQIEVNNSEVILYVQDNGVGFDPRYTHKLFGVFQRLHRDEEFEGTGIGLATVQRIIFRHGGRIWAESELNQGATFYFTLKKTEGQDQEKDQEHEIKKTSTDGS